MLILGLNFKLQSPNATVCINKKQLITSIIAGIIMITMCFNGYAINFGVNVNSAFIPLVGCMATITVIKLNYIIYRIFYIPKVLPIFSFRHFVNFLVYFFIENNSNIYSQQLYKIMLNSLHMNFN